MSVKPGWSRALPALIVSLFLGLAQAAWGVSNTVVISQVYGAGGNSGAVLSQDYIELFNNGTTPFSLNGYSLQYRSTTGTSAFALVATLPNVTLQPGQYYLFAASAVGANGTAITPDYTLNPALNLAGGAGQVALVNSTVAVAAGCSISSDPTIVDFVGYGTGTTCAEGNAPTATISATLAAFRKVVCTDTDNNGADFSVAAPAPRTSATAFTPCTSGGPQSFALTSASANPTTVSVGSMTLLTARVTPGTSPASTGITASVDLSGVGGSSTQPLYDDGTHGDTTAGDNVFNFTATVGGSPSGTVTLKFTASDAQAHTSTANASLTIQAAATLVPIHTIQASAPASTYIGQTLTTTGVVTAVTAGGFYLEARDVDQDTDPNTSEGIFVVSGTSSSAVVGNQINVTGTVKNSTGTYPATEIAGTVTITVLATGTALPTPVALTAANDSPSGGFGQFLKFQSMRFIVPNFLVTAPTSGVLTESTETVVSNGEFYGVVSGVARPMVEPGISVLETSLPTGATYCTATVTANCVPRFDGNPELMLIESTTLGGAPIDVAATQTITNLLGIVDFTTFNGAEFLLDKAAPGVLGVAPTYIPVPVAAANEITVGSMNLERFYSNTPASGAVTITAAAYQRRLAKASLLLRNVQRTPDIIGVQEVGTLAILNDIAATISTDAIAAGQTDPKYATCLVTGNDSSGINVGFLYKTTRVALVDCVQFGKSTTFTNSVGSQATLNDRPPLVLRAVVTLPGYAAFPITVISNHLRSLTNVDDTTSTGATVRIKKETQDEFLATLIQGYQANGDHVVVVGDLNSFAFSDGYVDNIGIIKGTPAPNSTVVVGTTATYVPPTPVLVDLDSTIADPAQRYDYSYIGNAQVLDHIIVTQNLLAGAHLAYSHEDADFPLIQYNDPTTPQSTSDHDGAVAYFPQLSSGQTSSASLTPTAKDFGSVIVGASSTASSFTVTNTGNTSINIASVTASGDFTRTTTCGTTLAAAATCTVSVTFTPTVSGARTGTLVVTTSAVSNTTPTATLTGSGTPANASVTLTPASATFATTAAGGNSATQVFTFSNTGNVTATGVTVTTTGDFSRVTTCGTTLAAASNCTITVTFSPIAVGARTGTLSVASSGSTAALVSSLSGTGAGQGTLTPATATFPSTTTGVASAAQVFTVTNTSGSALTLAASAISITGDYSQTTTCGTSLAAAASCTVSVVFKPTVGGARTGTLSVVTTLGTVSTTLTASLTGTGVVPVDFSLTPSSQTGTLSPGTFASTNLTLTPLGGYTGLVKLSCTGAPAGSSCTLNPSSVTLGATAVNVSVVLSTTKSGGMVWPGEREGWPLALLTLLAASLLVTRRRGVVRAAGLLGALLAIGLGASGCGSGAGTAVTSTPNGTYSYTITATDGTLTHAATYTLTVQ